MAGVDKDFDGVAKPLGGAKIGYLAQEPELEGETVQDCIEPAIQSSRALLQEYEDLSAKMSEDLDPDEFEKVCDKMAALGDKIEALNLWELDRTVERAMLSLRVPDKDAKASVLSGGEKRRVALCRLLLESPDLLLLGELACQLLRQREPHEPTNHLDAESVAWLERFLAEFQGTVVAVTHDRYFLENVAGWILELDRGKVTGGPLRAQAHYRTTPLTPVIPEGPSLRRKLLGLAGGEVQALRGREAGEQQPREAGGEGA
eukprot:scaffold3351_cov242-Pinguiococcus_pyrenoidosus.AAC.5